MQRYRYWPRLTLRPYLRAGPGAVSAGVWAQPDKSKDQWWSCTASRTGQLSLSVLGMSLPATLRRSRAATRGLGLHHIHLIPTLRGR